MEQIQQVLQKLGATNWNDGTVINNVVGMLGWKNYSNGHVIFDASASTSPTGSAVDRTNPTNGWTATYPTLMGWNGSSTYGVRVDSARVADNADQIDGWGFVNTGSNASINADTINSNGISYYTAGVTNFSGNASDGALYSQRYSESWQHQIAGDYRSGQIAIRGRNSGTWQPWYKVWSANNDGAGSGLDADLLDGLQASSFIQQGGSYYTVGNTAAFSGANDTTLSVRSNGPAAATMSFHKPGVFAANFGIDTDNQLKYGGWSAVDVHPVMHDGVYGGSVSNATNGGGVNYVYVDGTVSYAPTRGSCGNHVYQCWGGALTLTLNDASWQRGDIVVLSNVRGAANIVVNASVIYMPNGASDNQVTWNATVGSFRLCKY